MPTELRILRGNPRQHSLNKDEPKPAPEIPPAPAHLSKYAREEWDRITVELNVLGLLGQIDRAALTMYCTAWGRHVEAENHLRAEGLMLLGKSTKNEKGEEELGKPYPNPWMGTSNRAMEQMKSLLGEFGLTPSARTRLKVPSPKVKKEEALFG